MEINYYKLAIIFITNTPLQVREIVCITLWVQEAATPFKYLGLPLWVDQNKYVTFNFLRCRIWDLLQSWKSKLLSRAGKAVLMKSVIQAILNNCMGAYLLPLELCHDLEHLINSFWWGNKQRQEKSIMWMKWDHMCREKDKGDLGFKTLNEFNLAELGKQAWRLITNPNSLVTRFIKAKYYSSSSFLVAKQGSNPSYICRSLLATKELIRKEVW